MPHILVTAFQIGGSLILALGAACVLVGVLMSPILLGRLIGDKSNKSMMHVIFSILGVMFVVGAYSLIHSFATHVISYWPMIPFFVPMYMGLGLYLGRDGKNKREQNERSLANWQNQLIADRQADAAPVKLSADYREIAELLQKLGRKEEAADEYRHALILLEASFGGHPAMADYYRQYLGYLGKTQAEETTRITAKLDALPKL